MSRLLRVMRLDFAQALAVEFYYRFALVQSFLSVAVGSLGLVFFWVAAGRSLDPTSGYTPGLLVAYFLVAGAQVVLQEDSLGYKVSTAIRMGKLSASLLRPYPFILSLLSQAAAHATVRLLILGPVVAGLIAVFTDLRLALTSLTVERLALYFVALFLGLVIGWAARMAIGFLAFDLTQTWGPELIFISFFTFASGAGYPPDLLAPALGTLVGWTPFYYMVGFPALILVGRMPMEEALAGILRGGMVALALGLVVRWMWRRGLAKFEAVGI